MGKLSRYILKGMIISQGLFFVMTNVFARIGHFTVMDGSEAGVDLVLIQTFLLYNVNQG